MFFLNDWSTNLLVSTSTTNRLLDKDIKSKRSRVSLQHIFSLCFQVISTETPQYYKSKTPHLVHYTIIRFNSLLCVHIQLFIRIPVTIYSSSLYGAWFDFSVPYKSGLRNQMMHVNVHCWVSIGHSTVSILIEYRPTVILTIWRDVVYIKSATFMGISSICVE